MLKIVVYNQEGTQVKELELNKENLYVKECYATDAVRMKRMMPRAKGRGDVIQKRTCNITVVVAERQ